MRESEAKRIFEEGGACGVRKASSFLMKLAKKAFSDGEPEANILRKMSNELKKLAKEMDLAKEVDPDGRHEIPAP